MALVLGGLGLYSAFKFHRDVNLADMHSLHSWLGMGAIVLHALQVLTTISLLHYHHQMYLALNYGSCLFAVAARIHHLLVSWSTNDN